MDEPIKKAWIKGKPVVSEMDEFLENFRRGGGGRFRSKKFRCNFFALETALLVMNFRKNFEIGGGIISDPTNSVAIFLHEKLHFWS